MPLNFGIAGTKVAKKPTRLVPTFCSSLFAFLSLFCFFAIQVSEYSLQKQQK
jgi:hypothetical protein